MSLLADGGSRFTQLCCCSPQIYSIWKHAAALTTEAGMEEDSHLDLSEPLKVCSCWWHTAVSSTSIIWSDGNVFAVMVSFWQLAWRCVIRTCEYCISFFNTVCTISSISWKQRLHFSAHQHGTVGLSTFSFWLWACGCLSVILKYLFCNQNGLN